MKLLRLILLSFACVPFIAKATDNECQIEDFRYYDSIGFLVVEGSTTCPSGEIYIRLYDSSDDENKYLGNATGYINGYTFELIANGIVSPEKLSIKYTIE